MVVIITENATTAIRGEMSRWMVEPRAGVFVGKLSPTVRDKLWQKLCSRLKKGGAALIYSAPTEQGFVVQTFGDHSRELVNHEGLMLVRLPKTTKEIGKHR